MTSPSGPAARSFSLALNPRAWRVLLAQAATVLVLVVAQGASHAADDPPGRVGRVADVQGSAWLYDEEAGEWVALQRNRPVTRGDHLTLEQGARAELRIGSTTVRLDGGSELEFSELDDRSIDMHLFVGSVALRVRSPEVARELMVSTADGRFLPQKAGHYRIDRSTDTSYATAWTGELRFEAPDSVLAVPPGRRAEFWQEGPGGTTHYTWSATERDAFSDWVARANKEDSERERAAANRYVSPEMTGWDDLDRNGRWDSHPEYGPVWYPTVVATGWAPYRDGHWAWVRPWGWTWVDDAPWGFAPFHYGRWVHWGGRWCWAPGRVVQPRPVYSPALVGWVGGPQVNINIHIGDRPAPVVGWVPLGPRDPYRPGYVVSPGYYDRVNPWPHRDGRHDPRHPQPVPTGPIMLSNRNVPGAMNVAALSAMALRQPVRPVSTPLNDDAMRRLVNERAHHEPPPAPTTRVVPQPGGAVPVRPQPPQAPRSPFLRAVPPAAGATPGAPMPAPRPVAPGTAPAPQAAPPVAPIQPRGPEPRPQEPRRPELRSPEQRPPEARQPEPRAWEQRRERTPEAPRAAPGEAPRERGGPATQPVPPAPGGQHPSPAQQPQPQPTQQRQPQQQTAPAQPPQQAPHGRPQAQPQPQGQPPAQGQPQPQGQPQAQGPAQAKPAAPAQAQAPQRPREREREDEPARQPQRERPHSSGSNN